MSTKSVNMFPLTNITSSTGKSFFKRPSEGVCCINSGETHTDTHTLFRGTFALELQQRANI